MRSQIKLFLDNEGSVYTSGDTISGVAKLDVHKRIDVEQIVIYFYGIAKARNSQRLHSSLTNATRNRFETRETNLLRIPIVVFPPQGVQQVSQSNSSFTLPDGLHEYPFSVVIPYPNSAGIGTLPPSFLYEYRHDFAQVIYEVSAVVLTPRFYRSNPSRYQHIKFAPPNANLQINLTNVLLPPLCGKVTQVKYEPVYLKPRSSWKRILSVSTIKIPLELMMEFDQKYNIPTSSFPSRVVEMNKLLNLSFQLALLCPFNSIALREILFSDNEHDTDNAKGQIYRPDRATLFLTHISITLRGTVIYSGATTKSVHYILREVLDKRLDEKLELADFERTQYYDDKTKKSIFDSVNIKNRHLVRIGTVYKLPLQPLWFDGMIDDDLTSSFLCPNIMNEYDLTIKLRVVSLPGDRCVTLRCSSNVVLIRSQIPYQQQTPLMPQEPIGPASEVAKPPPPYHA